MEVKKNQIYEVNIVDNGIDGEGIAKIDGLTVFVPNTIKGEKVRIKILKVLSSHGFGKVEEILIPSESRRNDDCITYKKCGGCSMRHIEYEETLKIKRVNVSNTLKKQGIKTIVNETIGMEYPFFYRNKLQYPVGKDEEGKTIIGVFAERTHRIVPTEKCYIQNGKLQEISNSIYYFIKKNNIPVYDEKKLNR